MRRAHFYRYFFAFHPKPSQRHWLGALADAAGQNGKRVKNDNVHLTLCVVVETKFRDRFIAARADSALSGHPLTSCPFWLGLVRGGGAGAAVHAMPRQRGIQSFYRNLVGLLATRDIRPLYRKSGLKPHVTLGYDPCAFGPLEWPCEWIPDELLLIESEVGNGVHNVIARWPLLPPPQGRLALGAPSEPDLPRLAA